MKDDRLYLTNVARGEDYFERDSKIWLYNEGKRKYIWRENFEKEWVCVNAEAFRRSCYKSENDFKEIQKLCNVYVDDDDDYLKEEYHG